jgi:hypothetical protein
MNDKHSTFRTIKTAFPYVIAFGFVALGIYIVLTHRSDSIERDIGFANITFFSALILIGLTKKK